MKGCRMRLRIGNRRPVCALRIGTPPLRKGSFIGGTCFIGMSFSQFDEGNFCHGGESSGESEAGMFIETAFDDGVRRTVRLGKVECVGIDENVFSARPGIIDESEDDVSEAVEIIIFEAAIFREGDGVGEPDSLSDRVEDRLRRREPEDDFSMSVSFSGSSKEGDGAEGAQEEDNAFEPVKVPEARLRESEELEDKDDEHDPSDEPPSFADALTDLDESEPFIIFASQYASIKYHGEPPLPMHTSAAIRLKVR